MNGKEKVGKAKNIQPNRIRAAWITYQLRIHGFTQLRLAKDVEVSGPFMRQVIYGIRTSARCQKAIATATGFATWNELLTKIPVDGRAA